MTPEQLGQLLDQLGQRLGPAGSHVFELAVRQQLIDGAVGTILLLIVAITTVPAVIWLRRHLAARRIDPNIRRSETWDEVAVFGTIAWSLVVGIVGGWFIVGALPRLLNPEYFALRDLLWNLR